MAFHRLICDKQLGSTCINGRFKPGYEYIFDGRRDAGTLRSKSFFVPISDLIYQFIQSESKFESHSTTYS